MLTPGRFQTDPHLLKKAVAFGNTRDLKKGAKKRRLMSTPKAMLSANLVSAASGRVLHG